MLNWKSDHFCDLLIQNRTPFIASCNRTIMKHCSTIGIDLFRCCWYINKKIFFKKRLSWFVNIKFRAFKFCILFYYIAPQRFIPMLYSIFTTICLFIGIVFCSGPDYIIMKNGGSRQRQEMGPPSGNCMTPN